MTQKTLEKLLRNIEKTIYMIIFSVGVMTILMAIVIFTLWWCLER